MSNTVSRPRQPLPTPAIQWHEGMLLAPAHLQQLALRQEELLRYHAFALSPFHWGVRRLAIDPALLIAGTYRVTELEAVMPDGLVVSYRPGAGPALELDLAPHVEEARLKPLTLYLAVPARHPGVAPAHGEQARYESYDGGPVADENTGEGEVDIPRLRPRACLQLGRPPARFVSLALARISHGAEAFAAADFVPPQLAVAVDSGLGRLCGDVARRLREKAVFLTERVRNPSIVARAPQLLETRAMIQSLTEALPPFEALLGVGAAHPFTLYLALCSLVGHVSGIGGALLPPVLDPYDHDDPWSAFEQARQHLYRVIDEAIIESYTGFPFYLEAGVFSLAFDAVWRGRSLVLGVRGPQGATERDVARWMEECLIASKGLIPALRERRVLGAARQRIEGEGDLLPSAGVLLYSLAADPELVEANQLLQIVNPGDSGVPHRPIEIVLYVRNRP